MKGQNRTNRMVDHDYTNLNQRYAGQIESRLNWFVLLYQGWMLGKDAYIAILTLYERK